MQYTYYTYMNRARQPSPGLFADALNAAGYSLMDALGRWGFYQQNINKLNAFLVPTIINLIHVSRTQENPCANIPLISHCREKVWRHQVPPLPEYFRDHLPCQWRPGGMSRRLV